MNLDFPGQIFEKYTIINFHENPSSESDLLPFGQTVMRKEGEKLVEANILFQKLCERS